MLLTENRVSQVKEKYNIPSNIWDSMVNGSVSIAPNNKYLEWIAGRFYNIVGVDTTRSLGNVNRELSGNVLDNILKHVEIFDRVRQNLSKKDLYSYASLDELKSYLKDHKLKKRVIETHEDSTVVFEDDRFKVVVPHSHNASCYYGAGTKWCTATKHSDNQFISYDRQGKLFYILDKTLPTSNPHYKIALNKTYNGSSSYYDAPDNSISGSDEIISYLTQHPLMGSINEFFNFTYSTEIEKISEKEKQDVLDRLARDAEWAQQRRDRIARLNELSTIRKENNEWDPSDTDHVGIKANALMEYLKDNGDWESNDEDISDLRESISDLRIDMENDVDVIDDPNGQTAQDYGSDLNNLEEELQELLEDKDTVYDISYDESEHYGLVSFEYEGSDYAIGDDSEADEAAIEQVTSLVDDIGLEGFNDSFYSDFIDGQEVGQYLEEYFRDEVEENPGDYLDEEDKELMSSVEERIDSLDEELGDLRNALDDADGDDSLSEEINDDIERIEEEMEELREDDDNYEWSESAIDDAVSSKVSDAEYDPMEYIQTYGLDIENFIDMDDFIIGVIDADGRGHGLSGYDGEENEVNYDNEWYYIYQTN
jgi:hypothetical protein